MLSKDVEKLMNEAAKHKYYCECGHAVIIYPFEKRNKKICGWCKRYVFADKKEEFEYRMKERLKNSQKDEKEVQ